MSLIQCKLPLWLVKVSIWMFIILSIIAIGSKRAQAQVGSLTSADLNVPGDGLLTTDNATGLQWLDLALTIDRSFYDVSSQFGPGGEFEGFRYATLAEVEQFWMNAGIVTPPFPGAALNPANFVPIGELQDLVGTTRIESDGRTSSAAIYSDGPGIFQPVGVVSTEISGANANQGYVVAGGGIALPSSLPELFTGSWLVREAPSVTETSIAVVDASPTALNEFDVFVAVDGVTDIVGLGFDLSYDATCIQEVTDNRTLLATTAHALGHNDVDSDTIRFLVSPPPVNPFPTLVSGNIISLRFNHIDPSCTSTAITIENDSMSTNQATSVDPTEQAGTITILNQAPTAVDDVVRYNLLDTSLPPLEIDVLDNDSDADGHTLTATNLGSLTSGGTATVNGNGNVDYEPGSGFTGVDTFTYDADDTVEATTANVTVGVGTRADCNDDGAVDAADPVAVILETFDADGDNWLDTLDDGAGFAGNPVGCDPNNDETVNAGDTSCVSTIFLNDQSETCAVFSNRSLATPKLTLNSPVVAENTPFDLEISYAANGFEINTVLYELLYANEHLTKVGDVTFNIPSDFSGSNPVDEAGELGFAIFAIQPVGLEDGLIASVPLSATCAQSNSSVTFSNDPPVSYGSVGGASVPGEFQAGGVTVLCQDGSIYYVPIMMR